MPRTVPSVLPRVSRLLAGLGENIRKARLRRMQSTGTIAQRAGISRKTLYRVEQGNPAVALGIYVRVLQALRLEGDIGLIAADDLLGRKLQDAKLEPRSRAPRRFATDVEPCRSAASKLTKEPQAGHAPLAMPIDTESSSTSAPRAESVVDGHATNVAPRHRGLADRLASSPKSPDQWACSLEWLDDGPAGRELL